MQKFIEKLPFQFPLILILCAVIYILFREYKSLKYQKRLLGIYFFHGIWFIREFYPDIRFTLKSRALHQKILTFCILSVVFFEETRYNKKVENSRNLLKKGWEVWAIDGT